MGAARSLGELDLEALDQRVREQLLAHPLDLGPGVDDVDGVDVEVEATDPQAARAEVERMCQQLLANPLIESYEIELTESAGD